MVLLGGVFQVVSTPRLVDSGRSSIPASNDTRVSGINNQGVVSCCCSLTFYCCSFTPLLAVLAVVLFSTAVVSSVQNFASEVFHGIFRLERCPEEEAAEATARRQHAQESEVEPEKIQSCFDSLVISFL